MACCLATGRAPAQPLTALSVPSIQALVQAQEAATERRDWAAVQAGYTADAQVFGLYYDREHMPHVHNGPAAADIKTMAALTTVRRHPAGTVAFGPTVLAPGGQRAVVTYTLTNDYLQGGVAMHRVFEQTAIIVLSDGAARVLQVVSLERAR